MDTVLLRQHLDVVSARIKAACIRAGRLPTSVKLVAVSKTVSAEVARLAYTAGCRCFGENRPQELQAKATVMPADCEWHAIGQIQSNKARLVVQHAAWIHSVDRDSLALRLEALAAELDRRPAVLLQVNISGEDSKSGIAPEAAAGLLASVLRCPHLNCCGLMTMAPLDSTEDEIRQVFAGLRRLRDHLAVSTGVPLPELSMGMSGDYELAIEEGATLVRVGSAIFS